MMKLEQVQAQYNSLKPKNAYDLCPREGVYLIKDVIRQAFSSGNDLMAIASWSHFGSYFNPDFEVTIHLEALKWSTAKGPKDLLNKADLKGATLTISRAALITSDSGRIHLHTKFDVQRAWIVDRATNSNNVINDLECEIIHEYLAQRKSQIKKLRRFM